jgi:hypothetical protein
VVSAFVVWVVKEACSLRMHQLRQQQLCLCYPSFCLGVDGSLDVVAFADFHAETPHALGAVHSFSVKEGGFDPSDAKLKLGCYRRLRPHTPSRASEIILDDVKLVSSKACMRGMKWSYRCEVLIVCEVAPVEVELFSRTVKPTPELLEAQRFDKHEIIFLS